MHHRQASPAHISEKSDHSTEKQTDENTCQFCGYYGCTGQCNNSNNNNDKIHAQQEVIDEGQEFEMNQYGLIDMAQTELLYKKRGTIVQPNEGVLFSNTDLTSTNTMQAMLNLNRVSFTAQNQRG